MIKFGFLALCLSGMLYGMEDKNKENMLQMYNRDILPQMPAYTKVTLEKGAATLTKLVQTSFNSKDPDWKFKDIFYSYDQNTPRLLSPGMNGHPNRGS